MNSNTLYAIALSEIKGIGPVYFKELALKFNSPENVFKTRLNELIEVVPKKIAENIENVNLGQAERILAICNKHNIKVYSYTDKEYPEKLKEIHLPPPVLYVRGDLTAIKNSSSIGIVGTRKPTHYGIHVTEVFTERFVQHNITIVSGGAYGIDTIALRSAVKNKTPSIAVLGNGLLNPYPSQNRPLFRKIIETGGAIITEFPPEERPKKENFPRRNRIISALSDILLVVEAGEKSGSLITAKWAEEQGIEVYAVPGPITQDMSKGTNTLIQKGAKMALSASEIMADIGIKPAKTKKTITLTKEEKHIISYLGAEPVHIDTLGEKLNTDVFKLAPVLFSLELKGIIRQIPGKYYVLEDFS